MLILLFQIISVIIICRGDRFRQEFSHLGKTRSLLPKKVRIMALTATASISTSRKVCHILGMVNTAFVIKSTDKQNIFFSLIRKNQ